MKLLTIVTLAFVLWHPLKGQTAGRSDARDHRLCGTPRLSDERIIEQAVRTTLLRHPGIREAMARQSLRKLTAPSSLLTEEVFWVYDFRTNSFDTVRAQLMATGTESNVWVSLTELSNTHVTTTEIQSILSALEDATPAGSRDPAKGILQIDRQFFGDPPNINQSFSKGSGDGMTDFLILDIQDGWNGSGSYVAGYFFLVDVDPQSSFAGFSNRRDMVYIDSYPGIFRNGNRDVEGPLSTLAHEFQHLVNWNYNPSQTLFFNEGLSEYAEYLCGYGLRNSELYFHELNHPLLSWSGELFDYSRSALWTLYCGEQIGDQFVKNLVQNGRSGIAGFDSAAAGAGSGATFASTSGSFFIANYLQNRGVHPAYGYLDAGAVSGKPRVFEDVLGATFSMNRPGLQAVAADYIRLRGFDTTRVLLGTSAGSVKYAGIRYAGGTPQVDMPQQGSEYVVDVAGISDAQLVLIAQNSGTAGPAQYSIETSGVARSSFVLELANDDGGTQTTPNTLLQNNDTAFVVFGGVIGGVLDSVRMWFASTGNARLLVRSANSSYDLGNSVLTGLGGASRMPSGPVSFAAVDTGFMMTRVDLRQSVILTDQDFVVEIVYGIGGPNPLLRRDTSQVITRSYLSLSSQPTPGRTMYSSFGDFYVRAYLSAFNGTVTPPSPVPDKFALHQNYPNPFNPGTTIQFDVPEQRHVRLLIFDALGREIRVLKSEIMGAQSHTVYWDGRDGYGFVLPSGIYFCQLRSNGFVQTRKMLLLR